ncbi:MAG TPA: FAD-dependent monooxygenase [Pirellulales bacterium]|jgi:2-polyprenyl-6-methoxyphenol hydroxylase-like FAD-dependent oxidoreductase|nr:FAD-dependent monooxygenase [Pirellulales bacterium]
MQKDSDDILIVGAGPVGLMMAAELRRHGMPCRIVERLEKPAPFCKALGITPRTLEIWDDLGIVNQALVAGMELIGLANIANGDIEHAQETSAALSEGAYGFLTLAQYEVERILTEHLVSLGGQIERGVELAEVQQNDHTVQVKLNHATGSSEIVQCRYLIGCDGGRSIVRHALQLPFEGDHYEQVFMLADIELDAPLKRGYAYKMARFENDKMLGAGACIPIPGNSRRYRFTTGAPPEMIPAELTAADQVKHGISQLGPTLEQIQEVVDWLFCAHVSASNLRWSAFYRISHRIVSQYNVCRIFLAGDAAHLHPPLGGQGMNAGLQDAYNLAWKLVLELRGLSVPGLLESYNAERRSIGQQIVDRTTARMNRVMQGNVDEQEPIRDDSQLFLNYRDSPLAVNDLDVAKINASAPFAGDRAPDVRGLKRSNVHYESRLFDLTRGTHHTLLLYTAVVGDLWTDCRQFCDICRALRQQFGSLIQTFVIAPANGTIPSIEGLSIVADSREEFAKLYSPGRSSGILIRPDGYIGYRTESFNLGRLQAYLKRIFRDQTDE